MQRDGWPHRFALSASRWWCRRAPVRHAESNFISVTQVTVVTIVPLFQLWKKKREEPPNKKAATKNNRRRRRRRRNVRHAENRPRPVTEATSRDVSSAGRHDDDRPQRVTSRSASRG